MFLFIFILPLVTINADIYLIEIKPKFEFYDRRENLIITCDGSAITDNIAMIFHYNNISYAVPRINSTKGIYIGNFSAVSKDQDKVMILCIDFNTKKLLGVKVYALGYPPSIIPQYMNVSLSCRDFNFHRIVCKLIPDISTIQRLLGFEEQHNGRFHAKLYYSDSDSGEISPTNSSYELLNYVAAPDFALHIVMENMLGNFTFNYVFNKLDILKPNEPKIDQLLENVTSFEFVVDMIEFGNYLVTINCTSLYPRTLSQNFSFTLIGQRSLKKLSSKWPQNANIQCIVEAQMTLGKKVVGKPSDSSSIIVKLLEGKPNAGPYISPYFVSYSSISKDNILRNIVVYFMNIALIDRNGIITKYVWKCANCSYGNRQVSGMIQYLPADCRLLKLDSALLHSDLSMSACTAQGCSDGWTSFRFQQLTDDTSHRNVSIIRDVKSPDNLTILWNNKMSRNGSLLICTFKSNEDCSSIERLPLATFQNSTFYHIRENLKWKFAIVLQNEINYKLKWVSCFHNSISEYEVAKNIRDFNHDLFVRWTQKCNLQQCKVIVNMTIPTCDDLPDVFFHTLRVSYKSDKGPKDIAMPLTSEDDVSFTLKDISPCRREYKMKFYVTSLSNVSFLWFEQTLITDFWCSSYVVLVIFSVFAFIVTIAVIIWCMRKRIRNKYFKNMFKTDRRDFITRNNTISPIKLLNTNNGDILPVKNYIFDKESISSKEKDCTFSTCVNCSNCSSSNSEGGLVDTSEGPSLEYTNRPVPNGVNSYTQIFINSPKNKIINNIPSTRPKVTSNV